MNYKKPLMLIGQGAKGSRWLEYAEKYQTPVVFTRLAIDMLEYDHPLNIGHAGIYGDVQSRRALRECDLLFIAGARLSATAVIGYKPKEWSPKSHKLMVDIDPRELTSPIVKIDTPINTTCEEFFEKLLEVEAPDAKETKWVKECRSWKKKYKVISKKMRKEKGNSYVFTETLSNLASPNDIILVDTGSCFHVVAQAWKTKKGQKFITTGGLSSMGWWAASLGAGVLGHTICITGDGSFQMNIQELATVKHHNLPIKIFVWNNGGYGLIRATQERFMEGRLIGTDLNDLYFPDLKKVADSYEIQYFKDDIKKTLSHPGPVICEVIVPWGQELLRPFDTILPKS